MYIGLLMGELGEAEPIRNPSRDCFHLVHFLTYCQFIYLMGFSFFQNYRIAGFMLI